MGKNSIFLPPPRGFCSLGNQPRLFRAAEELRIVWKKSSTPIFVIVYRVGRLSFSSQKFHEVHVISTLDNRVLLQKGRPRVKSLSFLV